MTDRARAIRGWAIISVLAVVAVLAVVLLPQDGNSQARRAATTVPPTLPPPVTVTGAPVTSSTLQPTASTTRDPEVFTTGTVAGPIQVRVVGTPSCVGKPGEGYAVTYQIANTSRRRVGPVLAQLDLQPPQQPVASLTVGQGVQAGVLVVVGNGELVTVSWQGVTSFPVEVQPCAPAPADPAAGRVTTTT
jgi:hypothetical protein